MLEEKRGEEVGCGRHPEAPHLGRKPKHLVVKPHPSPRFREKVRLFQHVRGPDDDRWAAQFLIDGTWTPKTPVSLSTRDWDEACENARDKYALAVAGQTIHVRPRKLTQANVHNPFRWFAEPVIATLRQEAAQADALIKGKGHKFRDLARRIEQDLLPKWGNTPITALNEHDLNDWVADDYRVEDRDATVANYGRQVRGADRQIIYKRPAQTTLGNLDAAFALVWEQAVRARVVDRRNRPVIDKTAHGLDGDQRAFIDAEAVARVARVMDGPDWLVGDNGHTREFKRLLRAYIALLTCTGIRPGLEAKRIKIGHVVFREQGGKRVIIVRVLKNQGKHKLARSVVVYEADVFPIRYLLEDLIGWQRSQGSGDQDDLFGWTHKGKRGVPSFWEGLRDVLIAANALVDPMTGKERTQYSFRHYFATCLIERGLSVLQIAEWLGTSSDMIERHYNRFLTERNAHEVNGWDAAVAEQAKIDRLADEESYHPHDEEPERFLNG